MITARELAIVAAHAALLWRKAEEEENGPRPGNTIMIRANEDGSYAFGVSQTAAPLSIRGGTVPS